MSANYLPYLPDAGRPGATDKPAWQGPGVPCNFEAHILLKQHSTADAISVIRCSSVGASPPHLKTVLTLDLER